MIRWTGGEGSSMGTMCWISTQRWAGTLSGQMLGGMAAGCVKRACRGAGLSTLRPTTPI